MAMEYYPNGQISNCRCTHEEFKFRSLMKGRAIFLVNRSDLDNKIRDLEMKVKRSEMKIEDLKQQLLKI